MLQSVLPKFIVIYLGIFLSSCLHAQLNFSLSAGQPFVGADNAHSHFFDMDGDGDLDLVTQGRNPHPLANTELYSNDGSGNFTKIANDGGIHPLQFGNFDSGDVDGDGDIDLLAVGYSGVSTAGYSELFLNDGSGSFTAAGLTGLFIQQYAGHGVLADIDHDNDLDITITGNSSAILYGMGVYLNDGSGNFTEDATQPFVANNGGRTSYVDLNVDGNMDCAMAANFDGYIWTNNQYTSDGAGNYTAATADPNPIEGAAYPIQLLSDFNGDGAVDMFLAGNPEAFASYKNVGVYLNDGSGSFTKEPSSSSMVGVSHGWGDVDDVDNDGDNDIIYCGAPQGSSASTLLYLNDGNGVFTLSMAAPLVGASNGSVEFADVNGDGLLDIFEMGWNGSVFANLYMQIQPVVDGCTNAGACNYNASANADDGSCIYASGCDVCSGETDGTGLVVDNDSDDDGVCDADEIVGCQDNTACNYNDTATDDGACTFPTGCETCSGETDGSGVVVDNDSDDDGVCDADEIVGCQDNTACNYNDAATDDGACTFPTGCETCSGETDGSGVVVDNDSDDDGVCDADEIVGCQDNTACNYNDAATDDGACTIPTGCETCSGETDGSGVVVDNDSDDDGVCDADEIVGCQDNTACNYNAAATDSATCTLATGCDTCSGETDGTGVVVDNPEIGEACDDGNAGTVNDTVQADCSCAGDGAIPGCLDASACNYNSNANVADICIYATGCDTCSGETDGTGVVVDNDADDDGVCDADEIVGCQDITACNYNAAATDAVACTFATGCDTCSGETDGTGIVVDNDSDDDGVCDADEVVGCLDNTACNYNAAATDAAACTFATGCDTFSGETDGSGTVVDNDSDDDGVCNADEVVGCQDASACNYMALATDAGSCTFATGCETCSGETDGSGTVVDNDADNDGICDADEADGCTDPTASNYNPAATEEDGSCLYLGCTDVSACNYNPAALDEDYSCVYPGDVCDDGNPLTDHSMLDSGCNCIAITLSGEEEETLSDYAPGQYTLCQNVKADHIIGAENYRFRFIPNDGGPEVIKIQGSSNTVRVLKTIDGLGLGDYTLSVDAGFDVGEDVDLWILGTTSIQIEIITQLVQVNGIDNCAMFGAHGFGDYIKTTATACGVDHWQWVFSQSGQLDIVKNSVSQNRFLRLSSVAGLVAGESYDVTVSAVYDNGTQTPFSAPECIEIVGAAPSFSEPQIEMDGIAERTEVELTVAIYPNPTTGMLNLNLSGVSSEKVEVLVYSLSGTLVDVSQLTSNNGKLNKVMNYGHLNSGIYIIQVNSGGEIFSGRLVIQN